jgi:hypothetical protein
MPDTIDDARQLIESRLTELDAEAKKLARALASLGEGNTSRRHGPGRPPDPVAAGSPAPPKPGRRRRPGPTERAPRGQRRQELLAAIKAEPGARPSALARSIGIRPTQVHALIAKARAEKLIVKRGEGFALKS